MPETAWCRVVSSALAALFALTAAACSSEPPDVAPVLNADVRGTSFSLEPIQPIPRAPGLDPDKVALGRKLFADKRLSSDGTVACASCHVLPGGGMDGRKTAMGIGHAIGRRNTPTVFNVDLNEKQTWDGRMDTLEAQIDMPLLGHDEMAGSWAAVLALMHRDGDYSRAFARLYDGKIERASVTDAIATFERSLRAVHSRFDRYLEGDTSALSASEVAGYRAFKNYGCVSCHQGRNVGGNMFQKLGVVRDYLGAPDVDEEDRDLGRFAVTGREADRFVFRVPSLRLVSRTAPYFHDGDIATLDQAILIMGRYQLGREIPDDDRANIAKFLSSLAGELDAEDTHATK